MKCDKCKKNTWIWDSVEVNFKVLALYEIFNKRICLRCLLKSVRTPSKEFNRIKSFLRKKIPPKTTETSTFSYCKEGVLELRKRWLREDLNRVFERYRVLKKIDDNLRHGLGLARKPKRGQFVWREFIYKKELEK